MQKEKCIYGLAIIAGLIATAAAAQTDSTYRAPGDTTKIPEVVITATRSEQDPYKVGRSITVISAEDIRKSGYSTLSEALSAQEGLYVVGNGQTPGSFQSLFTRGSNNNQAVIMIDGVRLSDPSVVNGAPDFAEFSLIDVERIEIVRGSHSTMYGSAAVGGAVNIITRRAQQPGFHAQIQTSAGTFGKNTMLLSENVFLNYTAKNGIYVNAELYNANVSGLDATVDSVTVANPAALPRDRDRFDKMDVAGRIGYRRNKIDAYFGAKITQQVTDIDKRAYIDDDNYTIDFHRDLFTYGAKYKPSDKLSFSFYGGYSATERFSRDDSSRVDNTSETTDHTYFDGLYTGTQLTNELQANWRGKGIDLVAGGGMYGETMNNITHTYISNWSYSDTTDMDSLDMHMMLSSAFLRAGLDGSLINEKYKGIGLSLGARFNSHNVFGSQVTYDINPSVEVGEGGLLYGVYSTGFNAPTLYQMYAPDKDFVSGLTRGNDKLTPETSLSWELGFKQKINARTSVWASVFHTEVDNLVEYVYLWEGSAGLDTLDFMDYRGDRYLNVGRMINRGAEGGIGTQVSEKLRVDANLTLVGGKLIYDPESIDTTQTKGHHVQLYSNGAFVYRDVETIGLTRRPSTANLRLSWMPVKQLTLRSDIRYVGARGDIYYDFNLGPFGALASNAVEDYTLVDLSARYVFKKYASLLLRVENVLDKKYEEIKGFTTRGRGFYVTFRFEM